MRLLNVVHSANPAGGGVIEAVLQMACAQQRQGHVVEIASLDGSDAPWIREGSFPVRALGPGMTSYGFTPRLVSWSRQEHTTYDAVTVHGVWQFCGLGVRWALQGTHTPYFVFPHGMLDPWFTRTYPLKHWKKVVYWWLGERRVLRDARAVFFTSDEERRLARQSFRPYVCREVTATLGIAAPPGDPRHQRELFHAQFPRLREKRVILFLGRLHEKKGCEMLLRAFATIRAEALRADPAAPALHLVMAGPASSPRYLETLRGIAAACFSGADMPITWAGMLGGDLKWGAFRSAEVFVLPSHQENFGVSVVEALACAVPVLISDKVNIWREIEEDGAGLVEVDDLAGTERLLRRWMALRNGELEEMQAAALRCFWSRFEIERAAERYSKLLWELIAPGRESVGNRTLVH